MYEYVCICMYVYRIEMVLDNSSSIVWLVDVPIILMMVVHVLVVVLTMYVTVTILCIHVHECVCMYVYRIEMVLYNSSMIA